MYYAVYHALRERLERLDPGSRWQIHTGTNNAVLNWHQGWIDLPSRGTTAAIFWEFNDGDLVLKVKRGDRTGEQVTNLRAAVAEEVERRASSSFPGRRARGTEGRTKLPDYASLYRWDANLARRHLEETAAWTREVTMLLHPGLNRLAAEH